MRRNGTSSTRFDLDGAGAYDVVVIGSGIGGLTTAALLTKQAGKRVLVLERHYVAGGFTHSFARPGYDWDVGIHYVGDMQRPGHPLRRLLDAVSAEQVEWEPMGEVYDRVVIGDDVYDFPSGLREWKARMAQHFPQQRGAIDGYVTAVKDAVRGFRGYMAEKALPGPVAKVAGRRLRAPFAAHASRTTRDVLQSLTDDERLIAVLTAQWGDYGLPPGRSSFGMHAIVANHYWGGGSYPVGGASVIPAAVIATIEAGGGDVLVGAEVERILVDRGRAIGVRLADGREVRADAVVSNAGVRTTYGSLLAPEVASSIGADRLLQTVRPSSSHLTLYLGLDASDEELGLTRPNLWLYPGEDHDANVAAYEEDPAAPFPVVYASFPSAKDPDFARRHPGHSTIDVITMARHEWFEEWEGSRWHRRGEEYDKVKAELTDRLIGALLPHVPAIAGHIDVSELSTPLTTQHFTNYAQGELYGLEHGVDRFERDWLRPRTPVAGLYLTGQDILTAGFGSALMSGALTAAAMAGPDLVRHAIRARLPF